MVVPPEMGPLSGLTPSITGRPTKVKVLAADSVPDVVPPGVVTCTSRAPATLAGVTAVMLVAEFTVKL